MKTEEHKKDFVNEILNKIANGDQPMSFDPDTFFTSSKREEYISSLIRCIEYNGHDPVGVLEEFIDKLRDEANNFIDIDEEPCD